jgi:hypothetical protein
MSIQGDLMHGIKTENESSASNEQLISLINDMASPYQITTLQMQLALATMQSLTGKN